MAKRGWMHISHYWLTSYILTGSFFNMSIFKKWFEPIGLALLLVSYGWQCFEEHSTQMKIEGYFCEINEKMLDMLTENELEIIALNKKLKVAYIISGSSILLTVISVLLNVLGII